MAMFGNLGELAGMMKNFQNIQAKVKSMKEELSKVELTGGNAAGTVQVTVSGDLMVKNVRIEPALVAQNDPALLQQSVHEAMANALNLAKQEAAKKLQAATGGLSLPGLF